MKKFEDEYPEEAAFLARYYSERHGFKCPKGHIHQLPYFLHVGANFCRHIPLKYCK